MNSQLKKSLLHIILYQPEIPPNTGNVIRLCANSGARLHLIRPLGFQIDDRRLRRAGLDYHDWASMRVHDNLDSCLKEIGAPHLFALSTRCGHSYAEARFAWGDALIFGPETRGLPQRLIDDIPAECCLRLPMVAQSRSLNLSNSVAIVLYEAWRQLGFAGSEIK